MENFHNLGLTTLDVKTVRIRTNAKSKMLIMGHRICDKCGHSKETYGGKTCVKGHFICHSCASGHVHCPICGHTLR